MMSSIGFGYPDKRYLDWITCRDLYNYDPFDSSTISFEIVFRVMDRMHYHFGGFNYSVPMYILRKFLYEKILRAIYRHVPYSKWCRLLRDSEINVFLMNHLSLFKPCSLNERILKLLMNLTVFRNYLLLKNSILKERILYQSIKPL